MTSYEKKNIEALDIKADREGIITAYAAAFGNLDSYRDKITPGAFTKTIQERAPKIKVLFNHDPGQIVGKPQGMTQDNYGLLTATKMSMTQLGRDVLALAEEGAISELSIGYVPMKFQEGQDDEGRYFRELTEIKLYEYSFVTFPANEAAVITAIKNASDLERELARLKVIAQVDLKAGKVLSGANAKKIMAALKELQDILSAAGLDEAASSEDTSTESTEGEKASKEPVRHSKLELALKEYALSPNEQKDAKSILEELRAFGRTLGGD